SRKPVARPSDFSGAIEAAVAAAVRQPTAPAAAAIARVEPEEQDEPEVQPVVAPRIPTRANVAQQATFANAINLREINLIGVYGTSSNRYALVRQSNGKYRRVSVGDRLDGGTVAAITASELRYRKGSRMLALQMPRG
ncbi:MAG: translation initiation factor 2, partial [Cereibacter changlensis]